MLPTEETNPNTLPIMAHIEDLRFTDLDGTKIAYPAASNRTEAFTGSYAVEFKIASPVADNTAVLMIPLLQGYKTSVNIDHKIVEYNRREFYQRDYGIVTLGHLGRQNRVELLYQAQSDTD